MSREIVYLVCPGAMYKSVDLKQLVRQVGHEFFHSLVIKETVKGKNLVHVGTLCIENSHIVRYVHCGATQCVNSCVDPNTWLNLMIAQMNYGCWSCSCDVMNFTHVNFHDLNVFHAYGDVHEQIRKRFEKMNSIGLVSCIKMTRDYLDIRHSSFYYHSERTMGIQDYKENGAEVFLGFTFYPGLDTTHGYCGLDKLHQVLMESYRNYQIDATRNITKRMMLECLGPKI